MKYGECVILQIQGERYKMRKEMNGYYCALPTTLQFVNFNEVGFQILWMISTGLTRQEMIETLMNCYNMTEEFWQKQVTEFVAYLVDLQILSRES
jgi:hypothetical protein